MHVFCLQRLEPEDKALSRLWASGLFPFSPLRQSVRLSLRRTPLYSASHKLKDVELHVGNKPREVAYTNREFIERIWGDFIDPRNNLSSQALRRTESVASLERPQQAFPLVHWLAPG